MPGHLRWSPWPVAMVLSIAVLAALLGVEAAPATAVAQLPASVALFSASSTEEEAIKALESVEGTDLRKIKFDQVERLVLNGWWQAASKVITRSHGARLDFTAPVRRAVQEVKKEADSLLRWLDPAFARPAPTKMAVRWVQNTSSLMLAARFSPRWDGPGGANLAVFSNEKGRGHIDKERTALLVKEQLSVNITSSSVHAEITATTGNVRKRFLFSVNLFDEAVPERSSWFVEFRRAQGSMQMSTGALIPELRLHVRKRWPDRRQWPRLTVEEVEQGGMLPQWWAEAPGMTPEQTVILRDSPVRKSTPFTCSVTGSVYCHSADSCVPVCADCKHAATQHSVSKRCVEPPQAGQIQEVVFHDEDMAPSALGGIFRLPQTQDVDFIDKFSLHWGSSAEQLLAGPPIAETNAVGDLEPNFKFPLGTVPPAGASHLLVIAKNEAGQAIVVTTPIVDRVSPPPPRLLNFTDTDKARSKIAGIAKVTRADDETYVEAYELHFGFFPSPAAPAEVLADSLLGTGLTARASSSGEADPFFEISIPAGTEVPGRADHLVAIAIGRGGTRSEPQVLKLVDACPPTVAPRGLIVKPDVNPIAGILNSNVTVDRMTCEQQKAIQYTKHVLSGGADSSCDEGSHFLVYWVNHDGSLLKPAIAEFPMSQARNFPLGDLEIPRGVKSMALRSRNEHGEMIEGPSAKLKDDKSASTRSWWKKRVLAARTDGAAVVWRPFSLDRESKVLNKAFSGRGLSVLALDHLGYDGLAGKVDGSVACVNLLKDKNWDILEGRGAVTSLAFDGEGMQALRGVRGGSVDIWDLNTGQVLKNLDSDDYSDVVVMEVDWKGRRAITGTLSGSVFVWSLETGEKWPAGAYDAAITAIAASWDTRRMMVAAKDETLKIWSLDNGKLLATLEGHSEPVKFIQVDWEGDRALSVSEDKTVKLWDLKTREVTQTFRETRDGEVLALAADWEAMQAMAIFSDGVAGIWDLKEPNQSLLDESVLGDTPTPLKAAVIGAISEKEAKEEQARLDAALKDQEEKRAFVKNAKDTAKRAGQEADDAKVRHLEWYKNRVGIR